MTNTSKPTHRLKTYLGIAGLIVLLPMFLVSVPKTGVNFPNIDKVIHIAFHFVIAMWFLFAREKNTTVVAISGGYGLAIEIMQSFTRYRSFEMMDVVANTVGLIIALSCYRFISPVKTCDTGPESQQPSVANLTDNIPPGT